MINFWDSFICFYLAILRHIEYKPYLHIIFYYIMLSKGFKMLIENFFIIFIFKCYHLDLLVNHSFHFPTKATAF